MSTPETGQVESAQSDHTVSGLDFLIVLAMNKVLIAASTIGVGVLTAIICLLLPNVYTATAVVLPPQQTQSTAAALLGQISGLGGLAGLAGNIAGIKNPSDLYVGMLKSRTVADNIVARFELQKVYETETMVDTREELARNTSISAGKDGLITIYFDDKDPARAAAIGNAYLEELDKLSQSLALTEAAQRRLFFDQQLRQAKTDLSDAEIALKVTQEKTGLIKLDDQGRAIIEAVATLRAQISAKETELSAMRTFATEDNPDYVRGRRHLASLRAELTKLERNRSSSAGDILVPTGKVPEAGLEYLRKLRDVKYQEAIFELLAKQYEAAKIDEAKESNLIQVVDRAVAPDENSKPRRALIVLVSIFASGLVVTIFVLIREALNRMAANPALASRVATLRHHVFLR
jgi:tyrosine-protein kinase Etk/Wzc